MAHHPHCGHEFTGEKPTQGPKGIQTDSIISNQRGRCRKAKKKETNVGPAQKCKRMRKKDRTGTTQQQIPARNAVKKRDT